jgi:hypothetical protein
MQRPRLSHAQQLALLGIPVHREFIPEHTGFQWPTLARLKQLRLINSVLSGFAGKGKMARHVITPSGLRLRSELAIAAAARQGGDVKQAPAESPQSGAARQSPVISMSYSTTKGWGG